MKIDTSKVDWSLSDAENARRIGCHPASLNRIRHRHGIAPVNPHHKREKKQKKARLDWSAVDWSLSSDEIARNMGVTISSVYQHRSMKAKGTRGKRRLPKVDSEEWRGMQAKLSERKTVHQWLNAAGIPGDEMGKPICLLRRLRITMDRFRELQQLQNTQQFPTT